MGKHETSYARVPKDFYPTPAWVVGALAEHVDLEGQRVWECACGDGRMAEALKSFGAAVYATDIADRGYSGFDAVLDFTSAQQHPKLPRVDGIVTNPPFGPRGKLAEAFIAAGLRGIGGGRFLALLLPNDFDSAKTRAAFFGGCPHFAGKITLTKRVKWFEHPSKAAMSPKENSAWFLWWRDPLRARRQPVVMYAPAVPLR
jgi:hypothetical protein